MGLDDKTITKMKSEGMSDAFIEDFLGRISKVREGESGIIPWQEIGDLDEEEDEISLDEIHKMYPPDTSLLSKLVVIKLNGGLGTSMGLSGPKSLIELRDGYSFLDLMAKQIMYFRSEYGVEVPLIFMDSFNTQSPTQEALKKVGFSQNYPTTFLQHKAPRLMADTLEPASFEDKKNEWCPPGHGDIWLSLLETGLLDKLIDNGYEMAFVSNGDNLGATVDPSILKYALDGGYEFCMEMTPKTRADKKGGVLYRRIENGEKKNCLLLDTAQVDPKHMDEFTGVDKFRTASTNNLWINLRVLKEKLLEGKLEMSLIVNPKTVEGKDIVQLETAMGSAIQNFDKIKGIIVPRSRFAPVKKCEDLIVRRSDAYYLDEDFSIKMDKDRAKTDLGEVVVTLDEKYYKKVCDYERLFATAPSLKLCSSLLVKGAILFDIPISVKGTVSFVNNSDEEKKISSIGRILFENESVDL